MRERRVLVEAVVTKESEPISTGGKTCPVVSDDYYGTTDPSNSTRCMHVESAAVHPWIDLRALAAKLRQLGRASSDPVTVLEDQAQRIIDLEDEVDAAKQAASDVGLMSDDPAASLRSQSQDVEDLLERRDKWKAKAERMERRLEAAGAKIARLRSKLSEVESDRDFHRGSDPIKRDALDEARAAAQRWKERARDLEKQFGDAHPVIARLRVEVERLERRCERLKMEAETQASEVATQRSTVHECYRAVTQGRGEPADWNGAKPVVDEITRLRAELDRLRRECDREWCDALVRALTVEDGDPSRIIAAVTSRLYLDRTGRRA